MSDTPLNVFGRSRDAEGIALLVAQRLPGATMQPNGNDFSVVAAPQPDLFGSAGRAVRVNITPDRFAGEAGSRQALGMANFIRGAMGGPRVAELLGIVPDLQLAVAVIADPTIESTDDDLFRLALEVARAADGFVMDAGAGVVWASDGSVLGSVDLPGGAVAPAPAEDIEDDEVEPDPPSADRVKQRLLVLTAIAARGLAEMDGVHLDEARSGILAWADGLDLGGELEPAERAVLDAAAGQVPERDRLNATWRTEGAAVLAWALGALDLELYDQPTDPGDLARALAFPDPAAAAGVVGALTLRPAAELHALAEQLFAVHWRLREFSLRPSSMDFAEFARTAWFGPLDLGGVALVAGDLAISGQAIADADPNAVAVATSVVMERHLAANWLRDGGLYSETDTST